MVLELSKIWNWLAINHQYMSGNEEKSIWHFYIWIAKYLLIFSLPLCQASPSKIH
jgi:hypothetical protein